MDSKGNNPSLQNQLIEQAKAILKKLLLFFPIEKEFSLQAQESDGKIKIEINGINSGLVIGKQGKNLYALEYVLNRIFQNQTGSKIKIELDCDDYKKRQKARLEKLAYETAEEVRQTGASVALGPMSARERKIIHLALKDNPYVYTESQGLHPFRQVVVKPKNNP